jgi:hypothetical protein
MSNSNPICRSINEGHPPTTAEWNEWELKQAGPARRSAVAPGTAPGVPDPVPMLTQEQVQHHAKWLYATVMMLVDALDREAWDGRWTNRLMHAHTFARNTLEDAAKYQEPTDAVALDVETNEEEGTSPAEGQNPPQIIVSGNGGQAGEAEIHRSSGPDSEG